MRSLFFKIFASFWISTALIVGVFMATAQRPTNSDIHSAVHRGLTPAVLSNAEILIAAYDTGGCPAVQAGEKSGAPRRMPLRLLDPNGAALCDAKNRHFDIGPLPEPGSVDFRTIGKEHFAVTGVLHGKSDYLGLLELRRYEPPLVRGPIFKRLLLAIIISGLISAFLARYLTRPITRLRAAAQKIATGQFAARAGSGLPEQHDEVGQLVKDFDFMAERLEILIGAQQRLISDVSHELRSPLTRLKLALDLTRSDAGGELAPTLDRIERETERLSSLVGMLLTLSRLESGDAVAESSPVQLPELLAEIVTDVEIEANSRGCAVELKPLPDCWIEGDPELLRSAFENVVRNAIRYTEPGTTVRVSAECDSSDSSHVRVLVQDHGPGVPQDELENVFKPFYRVDTSRERRTGGVGLGLAIAERAIKLHNGRITAANLKDGGFQVEITLPLATVAV
jgi:Signal transduction histidine kinase